MDDKKKRIIYLILVFILALAFITLYLLDNNMTKSEGKDAFSVVYETIEPALNNEVNDDTNTTNPEKSETTLNYEKVQIINWDISSIDSLQIFSQRKDFTLINHDEDRWSIRSVRLDEKIPKANRAKWRILNIFTHLITNNYLTKDYSELAKYFEYPICTVLSNFKDGTQQKLVFIRIAEVNDSSQEVEMKTWIRVNDETVVYSVTYNTLERFLVQEKEFLKIY